MSNKEVKELLKALSDAINISDRLNLEYGDTLADIITEVKERYNIED